MTKKIKDIGIELLLGDESVRKFHDAMTSGSEGVPSVSKCLYHQLIALGESYGFLYAYTHTPTAFTADNLGEVLSPEHRREVFDSYIQATLLGEHPDNAVGKAASKFNEYAYPVLRTFEEKQQFFRTFLTKMTGDGTAYDKLAYIFYDRPAWIDVVDRLVAQDNYPREPEVGVLDFLLREAKEGDSLRDHYLATDLQARGLPVPPQREEYRSEFSAGEHTYLVSEETSLVNVFNALLWREENKGWIKDPLLAGTINQNSSVSTITRRLTDPQYRVMTIDQRTSPHSTEFQGTVLLCEKHLQKRGPEKEPVLFYVNECGTLDQPDLLVPLHSQLVGSANELAQQRGCTRLVTEQDVFPTGDGKMIDRKDMNLF